MNNESSDLQVQDGDRNTNKNVLSNLLSYNAFLE